MMLLRKRPGLIDVEAAGVDLEHSKIVFEPFSATLSPELFDFLNVLSKAFEMQKYLAGKRMGFLFIFLKVKSGTSSSHASGVLGPGSWVGPRRSGFSVVSNGC